MNSNFPYSMDNNRSNNPHPPPDNTDYNRNSNFSYLTQQSFRASYTSADVPHRQFEFSRYPLADRGSIQREIEKERIRAEIIMEEMMQRKILEAEVRRELMLERELALRRDDSGFGMGRLLAPIRLEPQRVPLLTNYEHQERAGGAGSSLHRDVGFQGRFERMPFQRDPVVIGSGSEIGGTSREIKEVKGVLGSSELSKDKVILLAKPSANLADIKRKAMSQSMGGGVEVVKKQKTKEDWSCALCRITATSEQGLMEHMQGKKHKIRQREMVAPKTGFGTGSSSKMARTDTSKPFTLPTMTDTIVKKGGDVQNASSSNQSGVEENHTLSKSKGVSRKKLKSGVPKPSANDRPKKKFSFFCEMCNNGAYSKRVFNAHKRGKKHLANLSKIVDAVPVEACAQKVAMVENMKAEVGAGKSKEGTKGEQVETKVEDVNNVVNREDMEKVLEMGAQESKQDIKGEQVEIKVDVVDSDVNQVEDKEMVLEIGAEETKGGTNEEVESKVDAVDSDLNKGMVLEMGAEETNEGTEVELVEAVDDVSDVSLAEDKKALEMDAEETKERTVGHQVGTKFEDLGNDVTRVEDKEKVLETATPETSDYSLLASR